MRISQHSNEAQTLNKDVGAVISVYKLKNRGINSSEMKYLLEQRHLPRFRLSLSKICAVDSLSTEKQREIQIFKVVLYIPDVEI